MRSYVTGNMGTAKVAARLEAKKLAERIAALSPRGQKLAARLQALCTELDAVADPRFMEIQRTRFAVDEIQCYCDSPLFDLKCEVSKAVGRAIDRSTDPAVSNQMLRPW